MRGKNPKENRPLSNTDIIECKKPFTFRGGRKPRYVKMLEKFKVAQLEQPTITLYSLDMKESVEDYITFDTSVFKDNFRLIGSRR